MEPKPRSFEGAGEREKRGVKNRKRRKAGRRLRIRMSVNKKRKSKRQV